MFCHAEENRKIDINANRQAGWQTGRQADIHKETEAVYT